MGVQNHQVHYNSTTSATTPVAIATYSTSDMHPKKPQQQPHPIFQPLDSPDKHRCSHCLQSRSGQPFEEFYNETGKLWNKTGHTKCHQCYLMKPH